jgi:hypothetical protein
VKVHEPPTFLAGVLQDGTSISITTLEAGRAFDLVHLKLTKPYQQLDAPGFPPRPDGTRKIAAGERTTFFRCEALALRDAGAAGELERACWLYARGETGTITKVPFGDLIDFLVDELIARLIPNFPRREAA